MENPGDAREMMIREMAELRKRVSELEALVASHETPKEAGAERFNKD